MKSIFIRFFFLFSVLFSNKTSIACSCSPGYSFCETHTTYDLTVTGVVVSYFSHGISLRIITIYHGSETRDTINVWDKGGPYHSCNDSLYDASAASLGSIGDTIIIALPLIDSMANSWDVIGDYRTPGFQCNAYKLNVTNNTVLGFISGSPYCFYSNTCLLSYNYTDFMVDFPINSLHCETWLNWKELNATNSFNYFPNPSSGKITFMSNEFGTVSIYNSIGQLVDEIEIKNNAPLYYSEQLLSGMYLLKFHSEKFFETRKLVVQ